MHPRTYPGMELNDKVELSDAVIRALKPTEAPYKRSDGGGLFIHITPKGQKYWRLRYWFNGKEKLLALGVFPRVKIEKARQLREAAKDAVANGTDPTAQKKADKLAATETFADIAEEYISKQTDRLAKRTVDKARWQMRVFINPHIGAKPIRKIEAQDLLAALRKIEERGKIETAHKTKDLCGRVFMYGIATGRCDRNIAADLKLALSPRPDGHLAAITDPVKVGELLRAIDGYDGQPATVAALRLAPHVFLRPGELRGGKWSEIDFDDALWWIPAERMKGKKGKKREHLVPLSRQALSILRTLHKFTGDGVYMFPAIGSKERSISENTLGAALRGLGYGPDVMVPHGFRSMASTLLHEMGVVSTDIELQLAHVDSNKIRGIYNRSERLKERAKIMQRWSDHLDKLRASVPKARRA
jgi:integrase